MIQRFLARRLTVIWLAGLVLVSNAEEFEEEIRPLVKSFCLDCHSSEKHKGDLDLERFISLAEVMKQSRVWQNVVEQVSLGEMPPKSAPQPAPAQRERLLSWANGVLDQIALAQAGDPGPVVLRRLSNAEYTYTVRDLTGVESLDPAREFPADSAAGEGFMNVGNALVMSPSLVTKYLDAAKLIARHAVLLPDGLRFSTKTSRRDLTEEILAEIRQFYRRFTEASGGDRVNLQGIVFETNEGGRLPLEQYLAATLELREQALVAKPQVEQLARTHGLSAKYLGLLHEMLTSSAPSLLFSPIRNQWQRAGPKDIPAMAEVIREWQKALWKFSPVGHIGKVGGPKAWMEPVSPLATRQELRMKIAPATNSNQLTLYLAAGDLGDGNENDVVVWDQPRLVAPGHPDLYLRDLGNLVEYLEQQRGRIIATASNSLAAVAEADRGEDPKELARRHQVDVSILKAWLDYLGVNSGESVKINSYLTNAFTSAAGYEFIRGWRSSELPSLFANSSDQHVRIPGNMKPRSVAVHPTPTVQVLVGWRSPLTGSVRMQGVVQHAHPECGNGVTWTLELRRGATRHRLAAGTAQGTRPVVVGPIDRVHVKSGDLISLRIGSRDGNHSCDLTSIDLTLTSTDDNNKSWDLAKDVSLNVLGGNPHPDGFGNPDVWHFYTEPEGAGSETAPIIPAESLLAKWQSSATFEEKSKLAGELHQLLAEGPPLKKDHPNALVYEQLTSLGGPLLKNLIRSRSVPDRDHRNTPGLASPQPTSVKSRFGLDPSLFGKHVSGARMDAANLCVRAPSTLEIRLPADLLAGYEFVTTGALDQSTGFEGSVQLQLLTAPPVGSGGPLASHATVRDGKGTWTDGERPMSYDRPIVANPGSAARERIERAFQAFRELFPAALCYMKIVPVDEVVTLTLYHREDHHLARLMLGDSETAQLDRLWKELHYVSHDALMLVDAFEQLWQYATQDADPKVFEPMREPIKQRAAVFQKWLIETEPNHLNAIFDFAGRAYRRPLNEDEQRELRGLYQSLRHQDLSHEEAVRLTLARVLVAPAFLYRAEKPGAGTESVPVDNWELATRLSYFLWSAAPDAELRRAAAAGELLEPTLFLEQARRMLRDGKIRRLATEFACAWLHIYGFDELGEKSERHFPSFASLRGSMYEEAILFFTDLFQNDRSVLNILDADHAFLNRPLAEHYGIANVSFASGNEWKRVEGMKTLSRGGILGQAATLSKQSGASRTSPILRGNWVAEVLLGDKLPRPPKDVPQLPEDEATEELTMRQLTERHSSDPKCYGCHRRIDAFGFSLEGFDAIGRHRQADLGGRPIDTRARTMDGTEMEGLDGLRLYLLTTRRDAFLNQFCRKLLGYALGRGVLLSDKPLIAQMRDDLENSNYRFSSVVETILRSKQFCQIRGKDRASDD